MTTYNGWTNYATWRVNLEIFDGTSASDHIGTGGRNRLASLTEALRARRATGVTIARHGAA